MQTLKCLGVVAVCLLAAAVARAESSVTWMIDETIQRADGELFWTSPTAIDLGFDQYAYDYEITRILASVLGGSVDVTSQIGASFDLTGSGTSGDVPLVLVDTALSDPGTGTMADVLIEVDGAGFGQAGFTNVVLGQAQVGIFRVDISAIEIEATVTLTGTNFAAGDYNRDGFVDTSDYDLWAADYGTIDRPAADGNDDGLIDSADYTIWRDNVPPASAAIPEPATALAAGIVFSFAVGFRRAQR